MYICNRKNDNLSGIPQLRVLVTSRCNSRCIYCRDGGETFLVNREKELSPTSIVKAVNKLSEFGMRSIKISGGEPLLRSDLFEIIKLIKQNKLINYVELITRDSRIKDIISELDSIGLDCINFSLDTLRRDKWVLINGKTGFEQLIDSIRNVAKYNIHLKINSVLVQEDFNEIVEIIEFLREVGGGSLKLLDLIDDIVETEKGRCVDVKKCISVTDVLKQLDLISISSEIINAPGGLGHPMKRYLLDGNVDVIVKTSAAGAFYHEDCKKCKNYPCYDALMALRLTPDGFLQRCLLRDDTLVDLKPYIYEDKNLDKKIAEVLNTYSEAEFYDNSMIENIRKDNENERKYDGSEQLV